MKLRLADFDICSDVIHRETSPDSRNNHKIPPASICENMSIRNWMANAQNDPRSMRKKSHKSVKTVFMNLVSQLYTAVVVFNSEITLRTPNIPVVRRPVLVPVIPIDLKMVGE
jgi:hypothetical protein